MINVKVWCSKALERELSIDTDKTLEISYDKQTYSIVIGTGNYIAQTSPRKGELANAINSELETLGVNVQCNMGTDSSSEGVRNFIVFLHDGKEFSCGGDLVDIIGEPSRIVDGRTGEYGETLFNIPVASDNNKVTIQRNPSWSYERRNENTWNMTENGDAAGTVEESEGNIKHRESGLEGNTRYVYEVAIDSEEEWRISVPTKKRVVEAFAYGGSLDSFSHSVSEDGALVIWGRHNEEDTEILLTNFIEGFTRVLDKIEGKVGRVSISSDGDTYSYYSFSDAKAYFADVESGAIIDSFESERDVAYATSRNLEHCVVLSFVDGSSSQSKVYTYHKVGGSASNEKEIANIPSDMGSSYFLPMFLSNSGERFAHNNMDTVVFRELSTDTSFNLMSSYIADSIVVDDDITHILYRQENENFTMMEVDWESGKFNSQPIDNSKYAENLVNPYLINNHSQVLFHEELEEGMLLKVLDISEDIEQRIVELPKLSENSYALTPDLSHVVYHRHNGKMAREYIGDRLEIDEKNYE